jgi:hypothetical protein
LTSSSLSALTRAMEALAAHAGADPDRYVVPSGSSRSAVETLARYGSVERLRSDVEAGEISLPSLVSQALNWNGKRANKPTVKAVAEGLLATRDDGVSCYPAAVAALAYSAACAPLLEPDQLARLIAATSATPYTYAPVREVVGLSRDLTHALGHYRTARREKLLTSLWLSAHNVDQPRWWDACSGRGRPDPRRGRRGGRAAFEAEAQRLQAELNGAAEGDVLRGLLEASLMLNPETCAQLRARRLDAREREAASCFSALDHTDPDVTVMLAQLPDLGVLRRPASPLPAMVTALLLAYEGEEGEFLTGQMPDKPTSWTRLFPVAGMERYAIPPVIYELHNTRVTNPDDPTDSFVIDLVRNDNELQANRDYMGNCTYTYRASFQAGTSVLARLYHGRETYNVAWRHQGGGRWALQEVNGYQNHRNRVPAWVSTWARQRPTGWRHSPNAA